MIRYPACVKIALAFALGLGGCSGSIGSGADGKDPGEPGNSGSGNGSGNGNTGSGNGSGNGNSGNGNGNSGNGGGSANPAAEKPGRTPLRRLTHDEYNHTIRDLFGFEGDFAAGFAGDEEAGGFAANTISPVTEDQADQYHTAAEMIAKRAVAAGLQKLAPCAGPGASEACATDFIRGFGRRAFRRPLAQEEINRYKAVFTAGGGTGDFAGGAELVLTTMLESPNFLYLPEIGDRNAKESDGYPLDPYETAARLSYFVIGSMPDDELSGAADMNMLRTPAQLEAHTRRLITSGKARDSLSSFYLEWLEAVDLSTIDKSPMLFPAFNPALRQAMADELAAFGAKVTLEGDGKLSTLLTAPFAYPNAALAALYGVKDGNPTGKDQVMLPAGQRAGIFTLAGVMALYAHNDQSRPVGRGYLVADKLLCNTPPAPPNNVVTTLPPIDPNVTTRERLEKHRTEAACASCHALFDPFGMTFEVYDAVGAYRTMEGKKPVDSSGTGLPGGLPDVKDAVALMGVLAKSDDVRACMVKQWFRYAFGRMEIPEDNATLEAAQRTFASADFNVRDLMVGIATSRGFRFRSLP